MGLNGVIPLVNRLKRRVNLGHLAKAKAGGITVAVDAYVWMHEFTAKHARRILLDDDKLIVAQEILLRSKRWSAFGVTCYLVFDGKKQKAKGVTNDERTKKRLVAAAEVERLLSIDDEADIDSGLLQLAAHVNYDMKCSVIKYLRENAWPYYMVAPFEADGQMAKLMKDKHVDYVLTVDSDLLALCNYDHAKLLLRVNDAGWGDLYEVSTGVDLAKKALGLVEDSGDDSDTDSESDDEEDEQKAKRAANTKRLSDMLLKLMVKLDFVTAIKWYGILVKNDYNHFKGCGPAVALKILSTVDGIPTVAKILGAIKQLTNLKRGRGGSKGISGKIKWGRDDTSCMAKMNKCITMFERQLVFDIETGDFVTLSGEHHGNNKDINMAAFDSIPRPRLKRARTRKRQFDEDSDDEAAAAPEIDMESPTGFSLGFYDDDLVYKGDEMPVIGGAMATSCFIPTELTASMVVGATLRDPDVEKNKVGELTRWLRCRGVTITKEMKDKAGLVTMVKKLSDNEERNPGMAKIFDPDGYSLSKRLLQGKIVPSWHVRGGGGPISLPNEDDPLWVEFSAMPEKSPIMSEAVVREYFKKAGALLNPEVRVLEEGLGLIQSVSHLDHFRYHPGHDGMGTSVFFTLNVPATARTGVKYPVWINATCLPPQPGQLGRIISIDKAVCGNSLTGGMADEDSSEEESEDENDGGGGGGGGSSSGSKKPAKKDDGSGGCKAQESDCIHMSAIIQAIQNIARPNATAHEARDIPPTSCICRWNNPGEGDMASPDQPLECLCFRKPRRLMKRVGTRICLSEELSRSQFSAMEEADLEETGRAVEDPEPHPEFHRAVQALFASVADDYGGRRCCAELQWWGGDAGRGLLG